MKIEKIELRHIKMELVSPFTTSMGTEYDEEHIIVRLMVKDLLAGEKVLLKELHFILMKQLQLHGTFCRIF